MLANRLHLRCSNMDITISYAVLPFVVLNIIHLQHPFNIQIPCVTYLLAFSEKKKNLIKTFNI